MSVPNKSLDKSKRYAGVKANDFVNKTRANEANRSNVRPQGWANLGKINSRRIPPPANVPSLKSETGVNTPTFDPTITTNHGWTSNESPSLNNSQTNPTQQQLDSLPVHSPTPPSSADIDKSRLQPTWSTITAGTNTNSNEQTPNLLALNDFPHLATTGTTQDRKSQSDSITNTQNPTFRPANLATWKDGGGNRVQPLSNDISQMIPTNNPGANLYQQQNMRMYPQQMWNYNQYPPMHQQQQPQRVNSLNEYKSPTILRNKDIDDLSKITDNTWATASQEVNYEEKIRFSDDEDLIDTNNKSHRLNNNQVLKHTRLIQDDKHLKQMQDNKNSELINVLTIAKQRRDEQERHLRNEQLMTNHDEQKPIPGYQTRPLLTSNDQENYNSSSSSWQTNKDTVRTPNSQSSFTMKSWSDQMDSFNYSSLHETSTGRHIENEDSNLTNQYSPCQNESNSQSQLLSKISKRQSLMTKKPIKSNLNQTKNSFKKSLKIDNTNSYDNSNDQWENWNEPTTTENHSHQQLHTDEFSTQKSSNSNKQSSNKIRHNDRQQINSRSKPIKINQSVDNKLTNKKPQSTWHSLSPTQQPSETIDPTSQESISYKSQQQQQRTNLSDHKQRYQTTNINTASIPPLMSVRSDATTTAKLFQNLTSDYYENDNMYYDTNLQTHQRYYQSNIHNRGYTTLGSYGRNRRSGTTLRHQQQQQQQYPTYNLNNTSRISSAPTTISGTTRQKKNSNNKKSTSSSEQQKISNIDENNSSSIIEEIPITTTKPIETSVLSSIIEIEKSNNISEQKSDNEINLVSSTKLNKKTPTISNNSKRRTNKTQHEQHYQNQQAPRHRNNYLRTMQEYEPMQMTTTPHNYYGTNHRAGGRQHDLSNDYYYEHSQSHYNNRYNYSNDHYQQRSNNNNNNNKNLKRGNNLSTNNNNNRQQKQPIINGNNNNNNTNTNFRHHSTSDNDQKEGEEWETASESSTNMRNEHYDNNNSTTNETKSIHRGRTPPKKSFSNQRPNARQIFKYTNA